MSRNNCLKDRNNNGTTVRLINKSNSRPDEKVYGHDFRRCGPEDLRVVLNCARVWQKAERHRGNRPMHTTRLRRIGKQDEQMPIGGSSQRQGNQRWQRNRYSWSNPNAVSRRGTSDQLTKPIKSDGVELPGVRSLDIGAGDVQLAASTASVQPAAPVAVPLAPAAVADPDATRQQMILSFATQSGMNQEWSCKCLDDNNWDFDRAAYNFTALMTNNQVPAAAFFHQMIC